MVEADSGKRPSRQASDAHAVASGTLITLLPLLAASLCIAVAFFVSGTGTSRRALEEEQRHTVLLESAGIASDIAAASADLAYLANTVCTSGVFDVGEEDYPDAQADLAQSYLTFSQTQGLYDQIRLLDERGLELVRVNFQDGRPAIVPVSELQKKGRRYYFRDTFVLDRHEVFVSPLDLNIERGEVEVPHKPMIRLGTPVFDKGGTKRGIVIVNYLAAHLLDRFGAYRHKSQLEVPLLLNSDGYWLKGPTAEDEWGFMFEDKRDRRFAVDCPEAWAGMVSRDSGQFETARGLFTFRTVYPLLEGQKSSTGASTAYAPSSAALDAKGYSWKVVAHVPRDALYQGRRSLIARYCLGMALLTALLTLFSWRLSVARLQKRRSEEKRWSELAVRESRDFLQSVIDAIPDPTVVVEPDFSVVLANRAAQEGAPDLAGRTGLKCHELLHGETDPCDTGRCVCCVKHVLETAMPAVISHEHCGEGGGHAPHEVTAAPIFDEDGRPARIVLSCRDISDRVRAEAERTRFMYAFEQAAESIVVTDTDGAIEYVNPAFERISGYSSEEALGKRPSILKSGRHDEAFYTNLWDTLKRGEAWTGHFINQRKNGGLFHEDASIAPVRDPAGRVVNYVAVKRDVTYEREIEERLRQSQKMEAIGTLAGGIAHDFNNILSVILGYAELASAEALEGSRVQSHLSQVTEAGTRAKDLVQQILSFSRRGERELRPLSPHVVVKEVAKFLRRSIPSTIEFELDVDTDCGAVMADPTELHQIIMNLCTNAYQAMKEKGGVLRVSLEETAVLDEAGLEGVDLSSGRYACLSVCDTGHGMDRETLDHIFEPYYTTKEQGEGTGLGLATVHGIVTGYGGAVHVYSEPGEGTVFRVYLPAVDGEGEAPPEVLPDEASLRGTERILVVDDEEQVCHLAEAALVRLGYEVTAVTCGADALDLFGSEPERFDVVVTDQMMPQMTGTELTKLLVGIRPEVPVVLCTGFGVSARAVREGEVEVAALVMKPMSGLELAQAVRQALDR
ncbi:MAG: PAS domain S-box protein [bacterium]|nr:PAS domain S-box protein [bacterium]